MPEDYDYNQELARAAFADMLHDSERNQLYRYSLAASNFSVSLKVLNVNLCCSPSELREARKSVESSFLKASCAL